MPRLVALVLGLSIWTLVSTASGQPSQKADTDVQKAAEKTSDPVAAPRSESLPEQKENSRRHRLQWTTRRFGWIDFAATGLALGGYLAVEFGTESPSEPRWTGGILFDDAVRESVVGRNLQTRRAAAVASDYTALVPQILAVFDGLVVPLIDRGNWQVAWRMTMINVQALSLTGLLSRAGHNGVGRQRPDVMPCLEDSEYSDLCFGGVNSSFPGGHTSSAFAGAGLVCAHHLNMRLYGSWAADIAACATNGALATATAVLRMVADRHYLSDNIVGALVGAGAGFVLPTLVYYRKPKKNHASLPTWTLVPSVGRRSFGVGVAGLF